MTSDGATFGSDGGFPRTIAIYLNDHRAGAAAGLALARRLRDAGSGAFAETMATLADDIEADVGFLDAVMRAWRVRHNPVKILAALAGERVSRLKPNGVRPGESSALSRLIGTEELLMGVRGKAMLWSTLEQVAGQAAPPAPVDLAELGRRARDQLGRIETLHDAAATELAQP